MRAKGNQVVPAGETLVMEMPGGGGHGVPFERVIECVAADVRDGLVSKESAATDYGVAINQDGSIDVERTKALREALSCMNAPGVAREKLT